MKQSACSLCQSKNFAKIGDFHFPVGRCQQCGLVQVYPLPSKKGVETLYTGDYFANYDEYLANLPTHQAYFRKKLAQIGERTRRKGLPAARQGQLLDIGCALGTFLELAQKNGWQGTGIEISKEASEYCQKRGLKVIPGTIQTANLKPNSFQVVTCFETIEHVREPQELVNQTFKLLKKGGLAVFATPNHDTWTRKLMSKYWFGYRHREHLFFFNPSTLKLLFINAGFAKIEIKKDDVRPFRFHFFLSRLAFYSPWEFLKSGLNSLSCFLKPLNLNIPTDPWGDLIVFAQKF